MITKFGENRTSAGLGKPTKSIPMKANARRHNIKIHVQDATLNFLKSEKGMVNLIEVIEYGRDDEPRCPDPEKQQTRSDAATEVNKTDGDKAETEDQKEDDDEDADYDDEEDDNDNDDDDDEEEEDDDGDKDDDEEGDGEDDNDGDEEDKENKRKFFLQDLKLFDCSNCHKRLFNTVYMIVFGEIVCRAILIVFFVPVHAQSRAATTMVH